MRRCRSHAVTKCNTFGQFPDGPVARLLLHTAGRHAGLAAQIYWGLGAAADAAAVVGGGGVGTVHSQVNFAPTGDEGDV